MFGNKLVDTFLLDSFALGVILYALACQDYPWVSTEPGKCMYWKCYNRFGFRCLIWQRRAAEGRGPLVGRVLSTPLADVCRVLFRDVQERACLGEAVFAEDVRKERRRSVLGMDWCRVGLRAPPTAQKLAERQAYTSAVETARAAALAELGFRAPPPACDAQQAPCSAAAPCDAHAPPRPAELPCPACTCAGRGGAQGDCERSASTQTLASTTAGSYVDVSGGSSLSLRRPAGSYVDASGGSSLSLRRPLMPAVEKPRTRWNRLDHFEVSPRRFTRRCADEVC